jgi:hypothetical protein
MDQAVIERLKVELKALKGQYRAHKEQAQSAVVRWRWATGQFYDNAPFRAERQRLNRGKLLEREPRSPKNVFAFGFDRNDTLLISRWFGAAGKVDTEGFGAVSKDVITERVYFDQGKRPGAVAELRLAQGRPLELYECGNQGDYSHETYHYRHGALSAIEVEQHREPSPKLFTQRFELEYTQDGGGRAFRIGADGKRAASFDFQAVAAPVAAADITGLLLEFETVAAREIHAVVKDSSNDPARSCIAVLGLGLLRPGERISVPTRGVGPEQQEKWNPAEFSSLGAESLQPRGADLLALDRKISAAHASGAEVDLKQLWNKIAVRLNAEDWSPLRVSKGFIVYAVDDGLVDLDENLSIARRAARR